MKYPLDFLNKNLVGKSEDLMKFIPDNSIDMTITSPPYDALRSYKGVIKDDVVYDGGYSFPFQEMVKELYRITKNGGVVVWVVNDQVKNGGETGTSFRMALYFQKMGFKIYDTMIYHKNGPPFPELARYSQVFEYMFVFSKGKPKTVNLIKDKENRWAGTKNFGTPSARQKDGDLKKGDPYQVAKFGTRYNVWYINNGKGYSHTDDYGHQHPASYPESLVEDHILSWSDEFEIILDPMCGGGTTCKMAKLNNRNFIGIDINKDYIEISNKRIDNIDPYNKENPNPKSKFIKTRKELLENRKKTRDKNKKNENNTKEELKNDDISGLYEASGLREIFENADKEKEQRNKIEQENFWSDDTDDDFEPNEELKRAAKEYKGYMKNEDKKDIDDFWI